MHSYNNYLKRDIASYRPLKRKEERHRKRQKRRKNKNLANREQKMLFA